MKKLAGTVFIFLISLFLASLLGRGQNGSAESRGPERTKPDGNGKTVTGTRSTVEGIVPVLQSRHSRHISCMAFSPDSGLIATGSIDNTVRLWNTSGKLVRRIDGFAGNVTQIIFSLDGRSFLTVGGSSERDRTTDNELKLFRRDGSFVAKLPGHTKGVSRVFFSAGGNVILSYSKGENSLRLWNRDGVLRGTFPVKGSTISSAALSPAGDIVAAAPAKGNHVYLWKSSGRLVAMLKNSAPVVRVAASPAGYFFATGAADGTIRLWDYRGRLVRVFTGYAYHDNYQEYDPFFSPDGSCIVTRAADEAELRIFSVDGKTVRSLVLSETARALLPKEAGVTESVWDEVENEERLRAGLKPRLKKDLVSYSLSPDGGFIIATVRGGKIIVWDRDGGERAFLSGKIAGFMIAPGSSNRRIGILGAPAGIEERVFGLSVWDVQAKKETVLHERSHYLFSGACFSPDGRHLASYDDTNITLWDSGGHLLHVLGEEVIGKVELHVDSEWKRFLSYEAVEIYNYFFKVRRWSLAGRLLDTLDLGCYHRCEPISGLERLLSSDKRYAALYDIDAKTKLVLEERAGKDGDFINNVSPDGAHILTVNDEKDALRLWTLEGKPVCELEGNAGPGVYTGFSPRGDHIVRVNSDKTARLWRKDGKLVLRIAEEVGTFPIPASFSPDGKFLAVGMESGDIRLYGLDGRLDGSFKSHRSAMVAFSPDGGLIVSAGEEKNGEGTVRVYRTTGEPMDVLMRGISKHGLEWSWRYGYGGFYSHPVPGSNSFVICNNRKIRLLDRRGTVEKTAELSKLLPRGYGIQDVVFAPKGICIAATSAFEHSIKYFEYDWTLAMKKSLTFRGHTSYITDAGTAMNIDRQLLVSCSRDGTIKYWSLDSGQCLATLVGFRENAGIIYTPDNYYMLSGDAVNAVAFTKGTRTYAFEQFDLRFNRPDIVLERIYPPNNRPRSIQNDIDRYRRYWRSRIRQNGFTEEQLDGKVELHAPEVVDIKLNGVDPETAGKTFSEDNVSLSFTLRDEAGSNRDIIGYRIFVNGVPVHGQYMKRFQTPRPVQWCTEKITLSSIPDAGGSPGVNRIEISGFSDDGVESNREPLYLHYTGPDHGARPDLHIVSLGINDYRSSRGFESLNYAVKDARDIVEAFSAEAGNSYRAVNGLVYTDGDVTRDAMLEIKKRLGRTMVNDTVIFFISGHGVRAMTPLKDAEKAARFFGITGDIGEAGNAGEPVTVYYYMPGDADADRPWLKGIPMDAIRHALDGIPARQKLLLVDTCQSGENPLLSGYPPSEERMQEVRKKRGLYTDQDAARRGIRMVSAGKPDERGVIVTSARALEMKEMSDMFPELRRGTGTIEISATTGIQAALESKDWTNGAFTYCVKEAVLSGKARTSQGEVTAKSIRKYVLDEVERLTGGSQTPMVCRDIPGRDFTLFGK